MAKIEDFYCSLEDKYKLNSVNFNKNFSFEEKYDAEMFSYELVLLNPFMNTDIKLPCEKKVLIAYCRKRISQVNNIQLKLKYHKVLLDFEVVDVDFLHDYVLSLRKALLDAEKNKPGYSFEAKYAFTTLLDVLIKYRLDELLSYKKELLDLFESSDSYLLQNLWKLKIALEKSFIKSKEIRGLPKLLLERVDNLKNNEQAISVLQKIAKLAKKTNDLESEKFAYEKIGDRLHNRLLEPDENNIAWSHHNSNILMQIANYYRLAKKIDKQSEALMQYEKVKCHHRFILFPLTFDRDYYDCLDKNINKLIESIISSNNREYVFYCLINEFNCLPWIKSESLNDFAEKSIEENFCYKQMEMKRSDGYNNVRKIDTKASLVHQNFSVFYCQIGFRLVSRLIQIAMENELFNFDILVKNLKEYGFMTKYPVSKNGCKYESSFYDKVNIGLSAFINCHKDFVEHKNVDWRFCIDFLTPKFEGLIRDIISLLGSPVTNIKSKNDNLNSSLMLLDQLLNQKVLTHVFDQDDLLLFKQTFTNEGYNIRNDVAHGLLMPEEYTPYRALLVFMSILRLAKKKKKIFIERSVKKDK